MPRSKRALSDASRELASSYVDAEWDFQSANPSFLKAPRSPRAKTMPQAACSLHFEMELRSQGHACIAGVDEAGRGPLAGPVVVAAVILPATFSHAVLNDSKRVSVKQRDALYEEITGDPAIHWAVECIDAAEIDRINILRATHEGMRRAVRALIARSHPVACALIDGLPVPEFPIPHRALVKGDSLSFSIAAASIVAKVTRDRLMHEMDAAHPEYAFAKHKGYGTALHMERLLKYGPCPIHRRSFLPVREAMLPFLSAE